MSLFTEQEWESSDPSVDKLVAGLFGGNKQESKDTGPSIDKRRARIFGGNESAKKRARKERDERKKKQRGVGVKELAQNRTPEAAPKTPQKHKRGKRGNKKKNKLQTGDAEQQSVENKLGADKAADSPTQSVKTEKSPLKKKKRKSIGEEGHVSQDSDTIVESSPGGKSLDEQTTTKYSNRNDASCPAHHKRKLRLKKLLKRKNCQVEANQGSSAAIHAPASKKPKLQKVIRAATNDDTVRRTPSGTSADNHTDSKQKRLKDKIKKEKVEQSFSLPDSGTVELPSSPRLKPQSETDEPKVKSLKKLKQKNKNLVVETDERRESPAPFEIEKEKKKKAEKLKNMQTNAVEIKQSTDTVDVDLAVQTKIKSKKRKTSLNEDITPTQHPEDINPSERKKKKKNKNKLQVNGDQDLPSEPLTVKQSESPQTMATPNTKSPFQIRKLKHVLQSDLPKNPRVKEEGAATGGEKQPKTKPAKKTGPQSLRERMEAQLRGARFRYINEQLYTLTSEEAVQLMKSDPHAFEVYHEGFTSQVEKWPVNPVDRVIKFVRSRPGSVVADMGCGDAKLAQNVTNKLYSFDLVAPNKHVTVCDIAQVPLADESVDIVVFCLALMGTNFVDFLCEANRILRSNGTLIIAEVISRFEKVGSFVRKMLKLGFELTKKDDTNKMFIWFEFIKITESPSPEKRPLLELTPCTYKKR